MRSIKRQVQHGPTCRSIVILVVGLGIISIGLRPRSHYDISLADNTLQFDSIPKHVVVEKPFIANDVEIQVQNDAMNAMQLQHPLKPAVKPSVSKGIHAILTSNGSPYMNWQSRIMYYTYLQVAKQPGSDLKHFTRVLHRQTDDTMMLEIPTVRVRPLDPSCDTWCDYPVASRPYAILQWLESGDPKGDWVLMIETDYVFVKPLSIPVSGNAIGFPFGYISPTYHDVARIMRKYYDGPLEDIPGTGNAPVLAPMEDIRRVIPIWVDLTAKIEVDEDSKKVLGWVREMYSFSIATAKAKMPIDLPEMPGAIMSQPPADAVVGEAAILHYTWGSVIKDDKGVKLWEFDKRKFTDPGLPDPIPEPPASRASDAQKVLITKINEAIMNLPKYTVAELEVMGKTPDEITRIMIEDQQKKTEGSAQELQFQGETEMKKQQTEGKGIHVMVTSNGNPYMNWQTRIMYYTWKKVIKQAGNDMKYFTRVLHRSKDDELMAEIPTIRVEPHDPACDVWCDYPVASRPAAIKQWLDSGDVKGDWIFMIETDYLFVKPFSIPASGRALGFPFGYIIPTYPTIVDVMKRFYPGDLKDIPQTGNAPVLARTDDIKRVVPLWVDVTAQIEKDAEAKEKLGWVREMYAFSIATALARVPIDLPLVPEAIMVQPPADSVLGLAGIIHYTWASEFKEDNKTVWLWDKRTWTAEGDFPPHISDPPEGKASELQLLQIKVLNEAIDELFSPKSTTGGS